MESSMDYSLMELELTNDKHLEEVEKLASNYLLQSKTLQQLQKIEVDLFKNEDPSLFKKLAIKLARSKKIMTDLDGNGHVTVIFAVYKEHIRIKTQAEHVHGENFLLKKVSQLNWLFENCTGFTWDLVVVDDGCPKNSGGMANDLIKKHSLGDKIKVLFLQDAIDKRLVVTNGIENTKDSQKGGAIQYGLWDSVQTKKQGHIVVFTDADLSTHLGQVGLLVDGIVNHAKSAAIGSRREKLSVSVKAGMRNTRGKLFIYLWKRMLPSLDEIVDTQCGFKAFSSDVIRKIIDDLLEKKFAFDIELLLKIHLLNDQSIIKVPIAWIDSEATSTTSELGPYLSMLKSIAKMYHKYVVPNDLSSEFVTFVESLTEDQFSILVDNVPKDIADKNPADFDRFDKIKVSHLEAICIGQKKIGGEDE